MNEQDSSGVEFAERALADQPQPAALGAAQMVDAGGQLMQAVATGMVEIAGSIAGTIAGAMAAPLTAAAVHADAQADDGQAVEAQPQDDDTQAAISALGTDAPAERDGSD